MTKRINAATAAPDAFKALLDLSAYVEGCGLEHSLLELVKIRASQINGCANCLHMHTADARKAGESEERIYLLNAWEESLLYTPRERAALAWTEALTRISETHGPDEIYEEVARHFSPEEIAKLSLAISVINSWNRIAIGFRVVHPNDRRLAAVADAA